MESRPYPERTLADGSRICGGTGNGTIHFFADGKVAVYLPWAYFGPLSRKLISRYQGDPFMQLILEHLAGPVSSSFDRLIESLLFDLIQTPKPEPKQDAEPGPKRDAESKPGGDSDWIFERRLDAFVSSIRAVRALLLSQYPIPTRSQRFLDAIGELARRNKQPPSKSQLTKLLCTKLTVANFKGLGVNIELYGAPLATSSVLPQFIPLRNLAIWCAIRGGVAESFLSLPT